MKLLVTDIDDTLSVGEAVSREVQDACFRLKQAGWDIMIATGRTFGTARQHIQAASATMPAILYDGCRIMTTEGEDLHSSLFDTSLAGELLEYVWSLPLELQVAGDEMVYCREQDRYTASFYHKAKVPIHYITTPSAQGPIYRIGLWVKPEELIPMEQKLRSAFGDRLEVTPGGAEFLDLLPPGVSKGSSLHSFLSSLPEHPEVVVAAGDHKNDLTMLRYADVAVVPSNAVEPLISFADIVMPRASQHGICALVNYLLSADFAADFASADFKKNKGKKGDTSSPIRL